MISPVISNDSTETPPATIQETTNETIQQSPDIQLVKEKRRRDSKKKDEPAKKRKTKETESPGQKNKRICKKTRIREEGQRCRKKKIEDDDEDYVLEDQKDEKTEFEKYFKSLRAKTTVKPLYDATKSLLPERKRKIREMSFGCMLDFPFQKIPWKKKLESDSPREYDDEFLKEFKEQFEFKKFITTTDLSKLIQKTIHTDFMFQINYLMLFANYMINCDNSSILNKVNWDDSTSENWYYEPNTVLMLIYLHYTKFDGMVTMPCKWPAIKNWTNQEVIDKEILKMNAGEFGKVEFIEDDDEGNANETEIEKQKLREFQTVLKEKKELEDLLKENMELDEIFNGDENLELFVETSSSKEEKNDRKLAATKKKEEAEKLAATKKEQAKKLTATKKKEEAEKKKEEAAAEKEEAEKEVASKKKEEA
ncbi:hypothetical protein Tco_1216970 [Tanacetum coccineum]